MEVDYKFDTGKIISKLGLEPNGRVQKVIGASIISHMRDLEPLDNGVMNANTRLVKNDEVWVMTPYAHYMNEGILYVMDNDKGAYYSPTYGFWSKKGVKKHPSGRPLQYKGGANRGSHFVERTFNEHLDDIINDVRKAMK